MAHVNKLLLMNEKEVNILTDNQLLETPWVKTGIAVNEVAYSARLNAILRQVTSVTHSLVQLAVEKGLGSYGSYADIDENIKQFNSTEVNRLLTKVTLEHAEDKNKTHKKNLVWASSPTENEKAPTFRGLVLADLPTITSDKIGENAVEEAKIMDGAVSLEKLGDSVIKSGKILDSIIPEKYSSVVGKTSHDTFANYNIVKMNLSEYEDVAFVKKSNTLYFLV